MLQRAAMPCCGCLPQSRGDDPEPLLLPKSLALLEPAVKNIYFLLGNQ